MPKKVPIIDRLEYWKFCSAHSSIQKAKGIAVHLLKTSPSDELFYPLITALYIFYCRPFKQKPKVKIPDSIVPSRFQALHETLLELRDKSFAHLDFDGIPKKGIEQLNKVMIRIENGNVYVGIANQIPQGLQLENVVSLCDELLKKCSYHSQKIWEKYMNSINAIDGDYEIDLQGEDAFLIKELYIKEPVIHVGAIKQE